MGHFTFDMPGDRAFVDTYVVVRNPDNVDQGLLNTTMKWSTQSNWKDNGDIYFFGDFTMLDLDGADYLDPIVVSYSACPFIAYYTNFNQTGTTNCPVYACPDDIISFSLCDSRAECEGDTYIQLFSPEGYEVDSNDNRCGLCSSVEYKVPSWQSECGNFTARLGCYFNESCSGTPWISILSKNNSKIPPSYQSWRAKEMLRYGSNQYYVLSYLFEEYSEYLNAYVEGPLYDR